MNEIWKPITGYKGFYEISSNGRVKSVSRTIVTKAGTKRLLPEKFLQPFSQSGYEVVQLWKESSKENNYVHRLVALHFIENEDASKNTVNHKDGQKNNNTLVNLEWLSHRDNNQHAIDMGLIKRENEDCSMHKFSNQTVREIRDLFDKGMYRQSELCRIYEASSSQVSRIVRRKLRILEVAK